MKRQYTFLLFILFSFLPLPFVIGVFGENIFYGALWDGISFQIVYISAILLFLMAFIGTKKSSKPFFIYKLIWLQEMFYNIRTIWYNYRFCFDVTFNGDRIAFGC